MDEVIDSLNEIISSSAMPLQDTGGRRRSMTDEEEDDDDHDRGGGGAGGGVGVGGSGGKRSGGIGSSVINMASASPVITVANGGGPGGGADLPSFHYFISEQAKSMLALQELQNEVGALLEFRDLVMEAFPQLRKMPQTVMSPTSNKWEPGIRVKRKLGQQLRDQECLVSSLVPRYRSNSQGKASRSGEASGSVTSSAIQDSGFCTESNKDHSSAISSSRSKSRETDDELFSLLDTIHSKGTRLKLEVEYLWNRMNRKTTTASNTISSSLTTSKRRCKSLDDLICRTTTTTTTTVGAAGAGVGNNCTAADYTLDCSLRSHFLDSELDDLKHERDLLLKKLTDIESEHFANLAQTNRLLAELENVSAEKRDLEQRLRVVAASSDSDQQQQQHSNSRLSASSGGDESQQQRTFFERNQPSRNAQTPFAKCQLLKLVQFFKENQSPAGDQHQTQQTSSSASSQRAAEPYFTTPNEQSNLSFDTTTTISVAGTKLDRPANPLTKELSSIDGKEAGTRLDLREEFDKKRRCRSKSECRCDDCKATDQSHSVCGESKAAAATRQTGAFSASNVDQCINSIGKPDILIGFLSGHSSFSEVPKTGSSVSLSKEKILGILNEYNPIELHRYLLTLSYQIEALNVHVQRISKSRLNIFQQLNRFKIENEDLRFQLEEKNIQLEGTKAKVRVLERIRNEKYCYSASDLMSSAKATGSHLASNDMFTCPVSDTALLQQSASNQMLASSKYSEKCQDLRDHSDNRTKSSSAAAFHQSSSSKRTISKIPLKTNSSKIPTKLVSCSSAKKLSSFKDCKEYSSTGHATNSSCVSSNSSSLNK